MGCFDVSEVIGVLLNDTELTDIFTGCSVVAGLLLSDLRVVDSFTELSGVLSKTEPFCDSIVVAVEKVFVGVLVKPVLNQSWND